MFPSTGGEAHIDVYGVRYEKDPLTGKMGTASDFGKQLVIGRVPPGDQVREWLRSLIEHLDTCWLTICVACFIHVVGNQT